MYHVVHALSQSDWRKNQKCWMSGPPNFCRDHVLFQNIFWDRIGHSELLLEVSQWFFTKRTFSNGVVLFSMGVVSFVDVIPSGPPGSHHQVVWCLMLRLSLSSIVSFFVLIPTSMSDWCKIILKQILIGWYIKYRFLIKFNKKSNK